MATQYVEDLEVLITRFNNYSGFGDPKKALHPTHEHYFYVEQTYKSILEHYGTTLQRWQPNTYRALQEKLYTYQQAVRDVEAGKQIKFPFIGGHPVPYTGEDLYPVTPSWVKWAAYAGAGLAALYAMKGMKLL